MTDCDVWYGVTTVMNVVATKCKCLSRRLESVAICQSLGQFMLQTVSHGMMRCDAFCSQFPHRPAPRRAKCGSHSPPSRHFGTERMPGAPGPANEDPNLQRQHDMCAFFAERVFLLVLETCCVHMRGCPNVRRLVGRGKRGMSGQAWFLWEQVF